MPDLIGALSYASFFLVFATAYAIIALGLNLQWGYTGLFNVGVAGFVAMGAYTSALLTTPTQAGQLAGFGLPVAVGMLAAMAVTGLVGALVGAVALRLRQDYLAITTFGIAVTIQLVANNARRSPAALLACSSYPGHCKPGWALACPGRWPIWAWHWGC